MGMQWDDSAWPVVRVHATGGQTLADLEDYIAHIEAYVARGKRFGLLAVAGEPATRPEAGTAKRQMSWIASRAEALRAHVAGLASVVAADRVERDRARMAKLAGHMPFPCAVFTTEREAASWLAERLAVPA